MNSIPEEIVRSGDGKHVNMHLYFWIRKKRTTNCMKYLDSSQPLCCGKGLNYVDECYIELKEMYSPEVDIAPVSLILLEELTF